MFCWREYNMDLHMMLCLIQPPIKEEYKKKGLPFKKDYFSIANLCIATLVRTGFPKKNITCITSKIKHARRLRAVYGINAIYCPLDLPNEFKRWVERNDQHLYYYKPFAFSKVMPEPINDHTVMAFSDIDILWKRNPYQYLIDREVDVWANHGSDLPRNKEGASKHYRQWRRKQAEPQLEFKYLSEYYYRCGDEAMAEVHLKYKFPLNRLLLFTQIVAIKPHVYKELMKTWYQMCLDGARFAEQHKMEEIGDQEFFSSAVWHMKLNYNRAYGDADGYFKHYGGERKKEMRADFKKYCKIIDRRKR